MTVRFWRECDLEAIARIEADCIRCPWSLAMLREEWNNPLYRCLVCEEGGEVCGYAGWWRVVDCAEISNVAVDRRYRRRGYARALLDRPLGLAGAEGLDVTLEVARTNHPALALYRAAGFAEEGVRRGYYGPGEDAVILWKRLPAEEG